MTTITNQVNLTGNLGGDVEVRESNDTIYAHLSIATNYSVPVGERTYEKRTSWARVTAFGGLARSLAALGKGSLVQVLAHVRQTVLEVGGRKIVSHDLIADEVVFLRVKKPDGGAAEQPGGRGRGLRERGGRRGGVTSLAGSVRSGVPGLRLPHCWSVLYGTPPPARG